MSLCLTRSEDESILLIDSRNPDEPPITITLASIRTNKARIRIDAPRHITILREELTVNGQE